MSNVLLSAAIKQCCSARAAPKLSIRLADSIVHTRRALVKSIPSSIFSQCTSRTLSISSRLERRQRTQQATLFPSSNIQPAQSSATHTEGVLDTEQWRDYDPAGGLPLPNGELAQNQIDDIFKGTVKDADMGNYILSVMHWRRMSGALIDIGIDFPLSANVTRIQAYQGLEYLRITYPDVDEQALGARWAEEESTKMRQELQDRAVKLRLYKPATSPQEELEETEEEEVEEESQQGTAYGRERSGTSAAQGFFKAIRDKNDAREEQKVIKQAQKERSLLHAARGPLELAGGVQRNIGVKRYGNLAVVLREPDSVATLRTVERRPWVKYYEEQATLTKENSVPQLSTFRRLFPSLLVMLSTVAFCFYLSENYTPPPAEARLFPGIASSVATLGGVSALLVGVFVLSRFPPLWRINNKYFCVVPAYPYALSNIGAIFRHDTFFHLAANTITLWLVGLSLHEDFGRGTFLAIFLGTGVIGTYSALTMNVLQKHWTTWIFGASGAVSGVLGALCVSRPNGVVSVFGYDLPMAAWLLLAAVGTMDLVSILLRRRTNLDHAGHLGGLISGAVAAAYLRRKYAKADETSAEPAMQAIEALE